MASANLAQAELKVGRFREAAAHLEYALANLPPEHADQRAAAETSLRECRAHLSLVRVSVDVPDAAIRLDGQELAPETISEQLLLDPGSHKLEASKRGYLISSRDFMATAGEEREVRLVLVPEPPPSTVGKADARRVSSTIPNAKAPESSAYYNSARTWAVVGGGTATAIAAGLGVFFELRNASLKSDSAELQTQISAGVSPAIAAKNTECAASTQRRPAACDQLRQTNDKRSSAAASANVAWVAAGVLGVATITTYLVWPKESQPGQSNGARFTMTPWLLGARGGAMQVDF